MNAAERRPLSGGWSGRGHVAFGVALVVFALWCGWLVVSVAGLRHDVEDRVAWLLALSRAEASLVQEPPDFAEAGARVAEVAVGHAPRVSPEVTEAHARLRAAVDAGVAADARSALASLVAAVRREKGALSAALGRKWTATYVLVGLALAFGAVAWTQWLRLGRQAGAMDRLAGRLAAVEERYTLAVEGSADGIWDWNLQTDDLVVSPRFATMVGSDPAQLTTAGRWFDRVHPDDRPAFEQAVAAHREGRTPRLSHEYRIRHDDGGWRWVVTRGTAVRNRLGDPSRLVGAQTDITARREAERTRVELVAGVGGRLTHPVAELRSAIRDLGERADAEERARLERVVAHIARLVDEVADLAALESGALHLRNEPVSVRQVVDEVLRVADGLARPREVTLARGTEHEVLVSGDRVRLARVLADLVANAIVRSAPGGRVVVDVEDRGASARLSVTDGGSEPVDVLQWVHLDHTLSGTGLAIARDLVRRMNGRLGVKPHEAGATFWFELPSMARTATPAPATGGRRP